MSTIALSHSRLSTYKQCPRKFKLQYIDKVFPDDSSNPHFVRGNAIHEQLEKYLIFKKVGKTHMAEPQMAPEAASARGIIDGLAAFCDDLMSEQQLAINHDWNKCGWFDGDEVRYRAILDVLGFKNDSAIVVDWKTGQVREYNEYGGQLHLNAAIVMSIHPKVQKVTCSYNFVDHKQTITVNFTRAELPQLQGYFDDQFEIVNSDTKFEPKINPYCKWCPATKEQCPYSKQL